VSGLCCGSQAVPVVPRWGPSGLAPHAATASSTPAIAASSSRHPFSSSQAPESSDWQTVKTSSTRPKGRRLGPSHANAPAPAYASASPLDFQEPWKDDAGSSDDHSAESVNQRRPPKQHPVVMPAVTEELPEDWEEAASAADAADEGAEAATEAAAVTKGVNHAAPLAAAQSDEAIASAAPTHASGQQPVSTLEANVSSKQHGAAVPAADDAGAAAEEVEPGFDAAADEAGLDASAKGAVGHDDQAAQGTEGNVAFGERDTGPRVAAAGDKDEAAAGVEPHVPSSAEAAVSVQVEEAQPGSISASQQGHKEVLAEGHESDDYLPEQQLQSDSGNGVASTVRGEMGQGEQRAVALDGEPVVLASQSDAGSSLHELCEEIAWMQDSIANTVQAGSDH